MTLNPYLLLDCLFHNKYCHMFIKIFSGDQYYRIRTPSWRNPERSLPVNNGYPRPLSVWWQYSDQVHQNTLTHIDGAIQYPNGKTYFFQGKNYYRYNDNNFKVSILNISFTVAQQMRCWDIDLPLPFYQIKVCNRCYRFIIEEVHYFHEIMPISKIRWPT